jgi:hypothetical protein
MSSTNLFAGGQWLTYFNTLYSRGTSNSTSAPYYYTVYTSWSVSTSYNVLTETIAYNYYTTSWTTTFGTSLRTSACVHVESKLPSGVLAKDVSVGSTLILADQNDLTPGTGVVSYSETKDAIGWKIVTENGATLICSDTAPIPTMNGIRTPQNLIGESVGTKIGDTVAWDKVQTIECVGRIKVQHITVGDKCFWAGETDKFILHHNTKNEYTYYGYTYYDTYFNTTSPASRLTNTVVSSATYTVYSNNTTYGQNTSYYNPGEYMTSYTTSWNVLTSRLTGG